MPPRTSPKVLHYPNPNPLKYIVTFTKNIYCTTCPTSLGYCLDGIFDYPAHLRSISTLGVAVASSLVDPQGTRILEYRCTRWRIGTWMVGGYRNDQINYTMMSLTLEIVSLESEHY